MNDFLIIYVVIVLKIKKESSRSCSLWFRMGLLFWECLFPHFNGLELGHPAFRLEGALALGIHDALFHTPLGCLGGVGICHIRKGRGVHRFRSACGVPHQQRRQCAEGACRLQQQAKAQQPGKEFTGT